MEEQTEFTREVNRNRAPIIRLGDSIERVCHAPAEQLVSERLMMFSLIVGLKPKRVLEIGTHWGGSTEIICSALDLNDEGKMVTVDPDPLMADFVKVSTANRAHSLVGYSPDAIPEAIAILGGAPDFIFIDGDHTYEGVKRDFIAALEVINKPGNILFHDSHFYEISDAIDEVIASSPHALVDCGTLTAEKASENRTVNGRSVDWGGLRLVRVLSADI